MITVVNALTFTTGGVLGYLIRILIDHRLARSRNIESLKIAEFNKAAGNFRSAFDYVLVLLRKNFRDKTVMIDRIITPEVLDLHDKARIQFEPFLDESSLNGFSAAWDNYEKFKENYNVSATDDLSIRYISFCIIDHIYELIDYAKPKF